jgi:hypothetical protein
LKVFDYADHFFDYGFDCLTFMDGGENHIIISNYPARACLQCFFGELRSFVSTLSKSTSSSRSIGLSFLYGFGILFVCDCRIANWRFRYATLIIANCSKRRRVRVPARMGIADMSETDTDGSAQRRNVWNVKVGIDIHD